MIPIKNAPPRKVRVKKSRAARPPKPSEVIFSAPSAAHGTAEAFAHALGVHKHHFDGMKAMFKLPVNAEVTEKKFLSMLTAVHNVRLR